MRLKCMIVVGAALFLSKSGFSQTTSEEPAKIEVYGAYSYFHFYPSLQGLPSRSFNGGGGGVTYFLNHFLGLRAEFYGYGSTTWTTTIGAPIVTPRGTIPAGVFSSSGNMFTYQFGPEFRVPFHRFNVFGEVLFGGSNSNGFGNIERSIVAGGGTIPINGTQHPFTMMAGAGVDVNVSHHFAIRLAELDYVLTRYTNPITSTNNQNNFRYVGGVVFKFK